jgi:hypothetical protein
MTTLLNQTLPTLADQVKRTDPSGRIADIVEGLKQTNPIMQDAQWMEGNLPTGHRYTSRMGLPTVAWRKLNEGITPSKSLTDQIDESCGMLSAMSVLDVQVAKLNGNSAAFRASEDSAFLQALNNEMATGMFYHSTDTAPEKFNGIAPRLASVSGKYGKQVLKAGTGGGATALTSVYLIGWGPQSVFCIYPKGSTGGLESTDMGEQLWADADSKKFRAYVTEWTWKIGLVVKDYRYVARLANIESGALVKAGTGATSGNLVEQMIKLFYQTEQNGGANYAFYCNRLVAAYLHLQGLTNSQYGITFENQDGRPVTKLLGIPVRVTDAITIAETAAA